MHLLFDVLESIFLGVVPRGKHWTKLSLHILNRRQLPGVVSGERRAFESLSQDLVAHANPLRVERRGEYLALRLKQVSRPLESNRILGRLYLHQV